MEWLQGQIWAVWLGAGITLGVLEMFSLDLILLMLAAGAFVGMTAALLGLPFAAQVLLAAGASAAMLFLVRPSVVKRLHGGPELRIGATKLVGMQGTVTDTVSALEPGRIKVDGEEWTARPFDETLIIEPGETVDVMRIDGATAYVHPLPRIES
ncbi:NfeD family protein [Nocardioides sp.]|uniref:NfeD family protein n=1 Tax=Nocardioides sp. TaxID=35761 RepID=UPI002733FB8F|nr:NfeD family protein [Nocardioides sp.]MDP3894244.1 NfeD family protein [Nocardioides sp.]